MIASIPTAGKYNQRIVRYIFAQNTPLSRGHRVVFGCLLTITALPVKARPPKPVTRGEGGGDGGGGDGGGGAVSV